MNSGDGQRPATVEGGQGRGDEVSGRGEQDRAVQRVRRTLGGVPDPTGPKREASVLASAERVATYTSAPSASAICAVRCAEPPKP